MSTAPAPDAARRRLLLALPLAGAAAAGGGFMMLLKRMREGAYDPHAVDDPRIGHAVPAFDLPGLPPAARGFSSADVMAAGTPLLINFFASWCVPCLQEAPVLMAVAAAQKIPLWGIVYKDTPAAASGFLARNGNPYARIACDDSGTTAINFGLYGVPESYFIDKRGILRWRWPGALTEEDGVPRLQALLARYA